MKENRPLLRILGVGFGLALAFGSTVGIGILRLPGMVAATLGDPTLIMAAWIIGGLYALMGAVAVAELAAMIPRAGGFRVYARRAYGEGVGFAVGWMDWLLSVVSLASVSITVVTFLGVLWPAATVNPRALAVAILAVFTGIHWAGLRTGSSLTAIISTAIGLLFAILIAACFLAEPATALDMPIATTPASLPWMSMAMLLAVVPALRAILTAYDGWYGPIYMAEENTDPARTLPRAIIGGTVLIILLYLLFNLALLRVLPMPVLAASVLPAADAARIVLPRGGAELVTVISVLTLLGLLNNVLLMATRVLFGIGRDGLFTARAAHVSDGGTPRAALVFSSVAVVLVILSGSFEQIIALAAILFLLLYVSAFLAVFVLRRSDPTLLRPYRAFGYPFTTAIVLAGSLVFLVGAIAEDPRSALIAAAFIAGCVPVYAWMARSRRLRLAGIAPE